ncbi:hypothetical protein P0Y31_17080 [Knoellia sp. 3-2P3]|uniref:AtpZ/AtpI family protein n=1 Tax=unclassified Knoellia TaxID=2618719 RepID=UPI0023DA44C8|nr:hypothetical protein [Knoellia sp. 3-2P3]MDF2094066.1 hypothetical protein [Knoellia sp. 3-2P3]
MTEPSTPSPEQPEQHENQQPGQQSRPEKHPQRSEVTPRRKPDESHRWSTETDGPSETAKADALGATVLAYLITGPALFGGLGYLLDRLLGTGVFVVLGVIGGMAASLYVIWLRYGTS